MPLPGLTKNAYPFAEKYCAEHPESPACKQWLGRLATLKGLVGQRAAEGVQYKQAFQWLKKKT